MADRTSPGTHRPLPRADQSASPLAPPLPSGEVGMRSLISGARQCPCLGPGDQQAASSATEGHGARCSVVGFSTSARRSARGYGRLETKQLNRSQQTRSRFWSQAPSSRRGPMAFDVFECVRHQSSVNRRPLPVAVDLEIEGNGVVVSCCSARLETADRQFAPAIQ